MVKKRKASEAERFPLEEGVAWYSTERRFSVVAHLLCVGRILKPNFFLGLGSTVPALLP